MGCFRLAYEKESELKIVHRKKALTSEESAKKVRSVEHFTYDDLSRLTGVSGATSQTQEYEADGRISENSTLGVYNYDPAKRYRLATMDLNEKGQAYYGQHTKQEVVYNAFKKPVEVHEKGQGRVSFQYGPLMGRSHAYYGGEEENKLERRYRKYYSSIVPVEIVQDRKTGKDKIVTYVHGSQYDSPLVHIKTTDNNGSFYYLHRDYLGSILAITDAAGSLVEQRQFGAWGTVDYFSKGLQASTFNHENSLLSRGYTGHEHFFSVSLIHMNGRMYDQNLGRFLSPDNNIQEPFNTQNFNRYGYAVNNPLSYTDPSGEIFGIDDLIVAAIIVAVFTYAKGAHDNAKHNNNRWQLNPFKWKEFPAFGITYDGNKVQPTVTPTGSNTPVSIGPSISLSNSGKNDSDDSNGSDISDYKVTTPSYDPSRDPMRGPDPMDNIYNNGNDFWENSKKWFHDTSMQIGNWWDNVNTAANMTYLWLNGTGAKVGTVQFENDRVANALRNSNVVGQIRDYWYNKVNAGKKTIYDGVTNFKGEHRIGGGNFGFKGIYKAGLDPIEQFVGSYSPVITSNGRVLTFTLQNTTSFKSLTYGRGPEWRKGPGGNFNQTYIFTEPINFNRIKK